MAVISNLVKEVDQMVDVLGGAGNVMVVVVVEGKVGACWSF